MMICLWSACILRENWLFVCKSTGVRRHRHLPVVYSNPHHLVHCKRKRCLNCYLNKKKTVKGWDIFTYYKCELCNVPLCKTKDCFEMFHQRTDSQSYNEYQNSCWNTFRVWVVYQIICIQSDFFLFYSLNTTLSDYSSYCTGVNVSCLDNLRSNIKLNFSIWV